MPHEGCTAPAGEEPAPAEQPGTPGEQPDTPGEQPGTLGEQPGIPEVQPDTPEEQHWGVPEEVHRTVAQPVGAGHHVLQGAVLDVARPGTWLAGVEASHGSQGGVGSTR